VSSRTRKPDSSDRQGNSGPADPADPADPAELAAARQRARERAGEEDPVRGAGATKGAPSNR
jgi:hypothetical protein